MKIIGKEISKTYQAKGGAVEALREVSFTVKEGEFLCLVGPSGCGKTSLLKLIAGLQKPTSGSVISEWDKANHGLHTAMVFQENGLFPWMTALENAAYGLEMQGLNRKEREDKATNWLRRHGLSDFAQHYPHQLSGGMQQRIAIARAFLSNPQILLMDEPFGALDAQSRLILQEELLRLWAEEKKTVVYVTHDIEEAIFMGDRILVMSNRPGQIIKDIPVPLNRPRAFSSEENTVAMNLKLDIWKMLETRVRQTLKLPESV